MAKKTQRDDHDDAEPADASVAVNDAWTGMLAVALLAVVVCTGFLAWDYMLHNETPPTKPNVIGSLPGGKGLPKGDAAKDAGKDAAKDAGKDAAKDAGKDAGK
jgi:hypothetical protein